MNTTYSYDEPPASATVPITADVTYLADAGEDVTYTLPPVENGRRLIVCNGSLEHFATDSAETGGAYRIYPNSRMELVGIHGVWE